MSFLGLCVLYNSDSNISSFLEFIWDILKKLKKGYFKKAKKNSREKISEFLLRKIVIKFQLNRKFNSFENNSKLYKACRKKFSQISKKNDTYFTHSVRA